MAGKRKLSGEEAELWRQVTGGVEPLPPRRRRPGEAPDEGPDEAPEAERADDAPRKRAAKQSVSPATAQPPLPKPEPPLLPALRTGAPAGLDKRTSLRLRRGQLRPEAAIDLHGHTQSEAHAALNAYISKCHAKGLRSVLVITGKGSVREAEGGILRRMTPHWLNQPPLRNKVLAIEHAQPRDGGKGALYVLLKRKR